MFLLLSAAVYLRILEFSIETKALDGWGGIRYMKLRSLL